MNDEMLRLSLIEIMNMDLLNDFINKVFGYKLGNGDFVYAQYKIVNSNIVLNIFDNTKKNRFKAFIFSIDNFDNDGDDTMFINIRNCYLKYKNKKTRKKLLLLGALLYTSNNDEKKEIIESLFDDVKIKYVLYKNFLV